MDLLAPVKSWLFGVALKKAAVALAQAVGSYALAHSGLAQSFGVQVSVDPNALTAALLAGSEVGRNWLKFHFPKVCGWL